MDFNVEGKSKVAELLIECDSNKYVVFYENELIAIPLEKSFIKNIDNELKKKLKEDGIGLFKRMAKKSEYWNAFGERFLYMSKSEIIEAHKKTEEISYSDIVKCKVVSFEKDATMDDGEWEDREGELRIKSKGTKFSYTHRYESGSDEYKRMVEILEERAVEAKKDILAS